VAAHRRALRDLRAAAGGVLRVAAVTPRYRYLGDAWTADPLRGAYCDPVRRADGKCIVGGSKMLVVFEDGAEHVVLRRRLRVRK
jgi:hypothetical protein